MALTKEQKNLILHTFRNIADSWRRHNDYVHTEMDSMYSELNIQRPDYRVNGERRHEKTD